MALAIASHYPNRPAVLSAMAGIAAEELHHYADVIGLLVERRIEPGPDTKDPYIQALNTEIRRGSENYLLDRLLVGSIVEHRGFERFSLIAEAMVDLQLRSFYKRLARSEDRHWNVFVNLAVAEFPVVNVRSRLFELLRRESEILATLPIRAALH
jgi:tRNA-(ms[2]io[6]A)-hydroxylase